MNCHIVKVEARQTNNIITNANGCFGSFSLIYFDVYHPY